MNRDTVIALAREAGYGEAMSDLHAPALARFAALVAAHEREECAKVCDEYNDGRYANTADLCAAAIRSRGT